MAYFAIFSEKGVKFFFFSEKWVFAPHNPHPPSTPLPPLSVKRKTLKIKHLQRQIFFCNVHFTKIFHT